MLNPPLDCCAPMRLRSSSRWSESGVPASTAFRPFRACSNASGFSSPTSVQKTAALQPSRTSSTLSKFIPATSVKSTSTGSATPRLAASRKRASNSSPTLLPELQTATRPRGARAGEDPAGVTAEDLAMGTLATRLSTFSTRAEPRSSDSSSSWSSMASSSLSSLSSSASASSSTSSDPAPRTTASGRLRRLPTTSSTPAALAKAGLAL
mmetsp:Transcript_35026/g.81275  ORF Transcript_35026/g.81275 Transcript_35026/m.81275 type:complete len:209 (-) Transcript_35026:184-810(-)